MNSKHQRAEQQSQKPVHILWQWRWCGCLSKLKIPWGSKLLLRHQGCSVCLLHSGAISSPFLFLPAPQGVVWLLPSSSPGNTGVPWLLPQPLTRNIDAGDDEPKVPGSSGGIEEQIPIGKHPRHNFPTLFFLDASMCSFLLLLLFFFVLLSFVSFPKASASVTRCYFT